MLSNYFKSGTKESMMRLASFLSILCIVGIVLDIVSIPIIVIFKTPESLDKVPAIIGSLAQVIGALSLIILYKGIQSFSENKNKGDKNEIENLGTGQGSK